LQDEGLIMTAYASALCGVLLALCVAMAGAFAVPVRVAPSVSLQETRRATQGTKAGDNADVRAQLVSYALSLQGIPYISGGRSAAGGDCSGTMEHIYLHVTGIDIGGTTFSQWPNLAATDDPQPGDLWFGQYADDQHVGMVADVDGDETLDLINNGGLQDNMHVDYNFLANPYFYEHTMGFRRAL
jgi:cell wall-associated NlpC family hydrolase